ncbi:putative rTX toxin, partial [Vibrio parahaemolyticus 10296]
GRQSDGCGRHFNRH